MHECLHVDETLTALGQVAGHDSISRRGRKISYSSFDRSHVECENISCTMARGGLAYRRSGLHHARESRVDVVAQRS